MTQRTDYFTWHFVYAPYQILEIGRSYFLFFYHYFSVRVLVKTLLAPWKRMAVERKKGFSFSDFFYVVSFNIISRVVGFFVRMSVLATWLLATFVVASMTPILLVAWIILPGLTYPVYRWFRPKPDPFTGKTLSQPLQVLTALNKTDLGRFLWQRLGFDPQKITTSFTASSGQKTGFSWPKEELDSAQIYHHLAQNWPPLIQALKDRGIDAKDVLAVCLWYQRINEERLKKKHFWELEYLLSIPGIGKEWAYGYTLALDKYSDDLTRPLAYSHHLVGREKVTSQMQRILSRNEGNNIILVGQPGVGRHTIVLELAKRIKEARVTPSLAHRRVLLLSLNQLLAGAKSKIAARGPIEEIFKEAAFGGNVILVIDNFDQYVSPETGRIDLTDVFINAVSRGVQFIGITNFKDFAKYIQPNQKLMNHFEKVEASPPNVKEAMIILQDTTPLYEQRNQVLVLYPTLKQVIEKVDRYVSDIPFPEKAIDLLDEACAEAAQRSAPILYPEDIDRVIAEKTKVPIGKIKQAESEKLANLEKFIHRRIINQEEAVVAIARSLRRARLGIAKPGKPIGTFLFLGPTGVGKTETAKALAETYFGSEDKMIRFDMSEYQGADAIDRVIGSIKNNEPGLFAKAIRKNPFSLLLLDEIEKAHRDILNLFLTLLDEGYFTDAFGEKVDCRNLIIIGTSNAGTELIRQRLQSPDFDYPSLEKEIIDHVQKQGIFSPEFINRFDAIVIYRPLTRDNLEAIAQLMLKRLNERLKDKEISVKITPTLVAKVAQLGYDPALGARPMNRVIQDKIEDHLAQMILKRKVRKGEEVEVEI